MSFYYLEYIFTKCFAMFFIIFVPIFIGSFSLTN
nr:MAG TPA: hypothetical protein [Caudoviricetes sp.]DAV60213.1 MAG TPA: hypothetical protein [Caudoviricetes sp.]